MDLPAILGGPPVREKPLHYGHQWIDQDDIDAVEAVLRSDYLTCGPRIQELEAELCRMTGAKYAVAVSSGTAALHCACLAAGIGPGDEVITTPLTFAASANCILYCGAKPVFADVDPETYNISPDCVRALITEQTKAVIAVDYTGQTGDLDELREICREHSLRLIEDAAHSIGSRYKGRKVGSIADLTTFSFHPVKTVTGGEGGAVLTDDAALYRAVVLAHAHGIVKEGLDANGPWYYEQVSLGYNYRMTDIQAALISSQLKKLDRFAARRREIAEVYRAAFSEMPELILQKEPQESECCRHLFLLRLNRNALHCSRRAFYDAMKAENIYCQVHYVPVYWFPFYRMLGYTGSLCPNAESIYEDLITIPLYPKMTDADVADVIHAVRKIAAWYSSETEG